MRNGTSNSAFRATVLTSREGHVLLAGVTMALGYVIWLGMELLLRPDNFQGLLGMTATEVVFGRVACMAFGYSLGLGHGPVILLCMAVETILVFIFYPLLVFLWRQLLVIHWLKRLSDRTRKSAESHKGWVQRYGIAGLFFFVWLPFWMTGPVVGCMIGYLLGLRVWVNITTVLIGTYAAIAGWAFFLRHVHSKLAAYSSYTVLILMVLLIGVLALSLLRYVIRKRTTNGH